MTAQFLTYWFFTNPCNLIPKPWFPKTILKLFPRIKKQSLVYVNENCAIGGQDLLKDDGGES
jgi:hypothetical protein